jgi:hypothetical protein
MRLVVKFHALFASGAEPNVMETGVKILLRSRLGSFPDKSGYFKLLSDVFMPIGFPQLFILFGGPFLFVFLFEYHMQVRAYLMKEFGILNLLRFDG